MKLAKDLVAASAVPLVLSVLAEGDSYGYAIIQRVRELSGGEIEWSEGMLYPVLHWLEEQECVKSRWDTSDTGRRRKYYSIQRGGRRVFREHMEQWNLVHAALNRPTTPRHV